MKTGIFITVRSDSTRLPRKCYRNLGDVSTIEFLINRVKHSKFSDVIVLCTTTRSIDDELCEIAEKNDIKFYRGSYEDKLERWNGACKEFGIDFFVTADGDDLFCDPHLIDTAFEQAEDPKIDFIKCDGVIWGAFTYGIRSTALEKVCSIKDTTDTEMMWVYFTDTGLFEVRQLHPVDKKFMRTDIRMTLDYEEDLTFFTRVFEQSRDC